jgi:7-carboxy-7-deazaguanine synthase
MVINEIFPAPQGEGLWTGLPMVFVRLQGCNLRCEFCDTTEAIGREAADPSIQEWGPADLVEALRAQYRDNRVVCFTGGEPLLQLGEVIETASALQGHGWKIHLETNGTVTLLDHQLQYFDWITVSPKGPNWRLCIPGGAVKELKFVMPSEDEYWADLECKQWAGQEKIKAFAAACPTAFLWFQPRSNDPKAIEWCLKMIDAYQAGYSPAPLTMGLSVQVHKFIGSR